MHIYDKHTKFRLCVLCELKSSENEIYFILLRPLNRDLLRPILTNNYVSIILQKCDLVVITNKKFRISLYDPFSQLYNIEFTGAYRL